MLKVKLFSILGIIVVVGICSIYLYHTHKNKSLKKYSSNSKEGDEIILVNGNITEIAGEIPQNISK